jgi:hypothetical protein
MVMYIAGICGKQNDEASSGFGDVHCWDLWQAE